MSHLSEAELQEYAAGLCASDASLHVQACAPCQAKARAWARLYDTISALAELAPRADFADQVMARVRPAGEHRPHGA